MKKKSLYTPLLQPLLLLLQVCLRLSGGSNKEGQAVIKKEFSSLTHGSHQGHLSMKKMELRLVTSLKSCAIFIDSLTNMMSSLKIQYGQVSLRLLTDSVTICVSTICYTKECARRNLYAAPIAHKILMSLS